MDKNLSVEWKPVPRWEGVYSVSDTGLIRRDKPAKGVTVGALVGFYDPAGYKRVSLHDGPRKEPWLVHRIVCEAFHGPPPEGKTFVLHGDGSRDNNHKDNLRWGDAKDNNDDALKHGTSFDPGGRNRAKTHCPRGHEYDEENTRRDKIGRRACKTCHRERFQSVVSIQNSPEDPRHGTTNGYLNLKCRCSKCKSVYSEYSKKRPKRKR